VSDQKTSSLIRHVPCLHDHHPHPQPLSRTAGEGCVYAVSVTGIGSPLLRSSPPSSPLVEEKGGQGGKVRGHPHCGAPSPPAPLPHCGRGVCKRGIGDRRRIAPAPLIPPFLSSCGRERGSGREGEGMNDLAKLYRIFNLRSQSFAIVKISTEDWLT
jgi:hypothetical protein